MGDASERRLMTALVPRPGRIVLGHVELESTCDISHERRAAGLARR